MKGADSNESMAALRSKLSELKSYRKTLQDQISRHDTESKYLDAELTRLENELERREKGFIEKREKLDKYNEVLDTSEAALRRLKETATKLDGILGNELDIIKSGGVKEQ